MGRWRWPRVSSRRVSERRLLAAQLIEAVLFFSVAAPTDVAGKQRAATEVPKSSRICQAERFGTPCAHA